MSEILEQNISRLSTQIEAMEDISGLKSELNDYNFQATLDQEVKWEDIMRARNLEFIKDASYKQRHKEDFIERSQEAHDKFAKQPVLDCLKAQNITYSAEKVLSEHNFDESKYIDSLDLKNLKKIIFDNLKRCLGTIGKIERI
jgi:hypothetical protein